MADMQRVATDHLLEAPGVVPFPTEHVLLLPIALPPMSAARRREAAPFAVEAHLARPVEEVHATVVGPAESARGGATDRWLVAVADRKILAQWGFPGSRRGRLLPDVLCLPRPLPGAWSVWEANGRVLVRTSDGAGFAVRHATFELAHRLAGMPAIDLYGGEFQEIAGLRRIANHLVVPDPAYPRFDLRLRDAAWPTLRLTRVAAIVALAGLGHIGILLADVASLRTTLAAQQTTYAEVLSFAGLPPSTTPDTILALRDRAQTPARAAPVLPAMAAAVEALAGAADGIGLRELTLQGNPGSLSLIAEAPDLAALQKVEQAFAQRGLLVEAGPAVNDGGVAEQTFILRGDGP